MQSHRQGLDHGALLVADMVSQLVRLPGLNHQLLAKSPLHVRVAHGTAVVAHVQAMVVQALLAVPAHPTGTAGADGDALTHREPFSACAHLGDDTGHFMAQDHGFLQPHRAKPPLMKIMQV